jgi:hypothetical protein
MVIAATFTAASLSVMIHYEGLLFVSRNLQRLGGTRHIKVL